VWNADTTWPHEITSSSAAIERAASHQQAYYADLGQPLAGHPEWMQPDGVHPTADGQKAIADAVHREIAPHVAP
jgi:acyl-CoA thioesterase-1